MGPVLNDLLSRRWLEVPSAEPAVFHRDQPLRRQFVFVLHRIVEIKGVGTDQTILQRIGQLGHRHHLGLALYLEGKGQPVKQLDLEFLFDCLDQPDAAVGAAPTDARRVLVGHQYDELAIEQIGISLYRGAMRFPVSDKFFEHFFYLKRLRQEK